jgi:hypothetical protein
MPPTSETRVELSQLSARVAGADASGGPVETVVRKVRRFLMRERPPLGEQIAVRAADGAIVLRSEGDNAEALVREARLLLTSDPAVEAADVLEVDAAEFAVQADTEADRTGQRSEILRSRVRYFPYPTCEWFEIGIGDLVLTETDIIFEPEWQIVRDEDAAPSGQHRILLEGVTGFRSGRWWDVPCLLVQTSGRTYRYGWPAERRELDRIFSVQEWLRQLRSMLE